MRTQERFFKEDDLVTRLEDSVVRYRGQPVVVNRVNGFTVQIRDIVTGRIGVVDANWDDELDISSPPLGYVNCELGCSYISRIPYRKYKQGVTANNCHSVFEGPFRFDIKHIRALIPSGELGNTILGVFPTAQEVLKQLTTTNLASRAFNRRFAFVKDEVGLIKLRHMTRTIGWYDAKDKVVIIPPELNSSVFTNRLTAMGVPLA